MLFVISFVHSFIHLFIHSFISFIHSFIHSFILFIHTFIHSFHSLSYFSTVRIDRARDRSDRARNRRRNSCFSSFHSLSYSSTVRWVELGIGLIELWIGLRMNNARHTVLARVSGLVIVFELTVQMIKWPQIQPLPTCTRLRWPCIRPFYLAGCLHKHANR